MKFRKDKIIYNSIINTMCSDPRNYKICLMMCENIREENIRKEIQKFINKVAIKN